MKKKRPLAVVTGGLESFPQQGVENLSIKKLSKSRPHPQYKTSKTFCQGFLFISFNRTKTDVFALSPIRSLMYSTVSESVKVTKILSKSLLEKCVILMSSDLGIFFFS